MEKYLFERKLQSRQFIRFFHDEVINVEESIDNSEFSYEDFNEMIIDVGELESFYRQLRKGKVTHLQVSKDWAGNDDMTFLIGIRVGRKISYKKEQVSKFEIMDFQDD